MGLDSSLRFSSGELLGCHAACWSGWSPVIYLFRIASCATLVTATVSPKHHGRIHQAGARHHYGASDTGHCSGEEPRGA